MSSHTRYDPGSLIGNRNNSLRWIHAGLATNGNAKIRRDGRTIFFDNPPYPAAIVADFLPPTARIVRGLSEYVRPVRGRTTGAITVDDIIRYQLYFGRSRSA